MSAFDMTPATDRLATLVAAVPDDVLTGPTPCPDMSVGDLVDHIAGLSLAFTAAATKEPLPGGPAGPSADASQLADDWRTSVPARLHGLAEAWQRPEAWDGMTIAGPIEMPAPVAGLVTLDEIVVHGWDLARATGQPFAVEPDLLELLHGFVAQFTGPGKEADREGLFGPEVPVPDGAPLLDRVIGMTGRDPAWSPT
ncbi:TIGR03086 family protein [Iamia sp. SCSIO 61187]|uniref:TIGR03086 family metal-binding protein n=1 Tax=Iamia sp. SCSIO 61187 TaxID=2722752 RepID=UPI001C62F3E3|nr:TIGR03086 family metal-binding protein [Iamia sp. SCSIO 61187]QYG92143.1 TIGR03086 family protein [Iamia sp. SCSIO 61187]